MSAPERPIVPTVDWYFTCVNPNCTGRRRQYANEKSFGMHLERSETCNQYYLSDSTHELLQLVKLLHESEPNSNQKSKSNFISHRQLNPLLSQVTTF